jgi:cell division protein FtsI/penicillin-binding protein 2
MRVVQGRCGRQELRNLEPPVHRAVPGNNVVLTMDTRLQKIAEASLVDEMDFWNTFFGHNPYFERCGHRHEPENR